MPSLEKFAAHPVPPDIRPRGDGGVEKILFECARADVRGHDRGDDGAKAVYDNAGGAELIYEHEFIR